MYKKKLKKAEASLDSYFKGIKPISCPEDCCDYPGGIKGVFFVPIGSVSSTGEQITEDAEFEIIEPKQLPNA